MATKEKLHRYVMSYSQAESGWIVVYAKCLEDAEEKFEKGDYVLEDKN